MRRVAIHWLPRERDGKQYAQLRWSDGTARRQETIGYVTEREAEAARARAEAKLLGMEAGSSPATAPRAVPTVGELVEGWLSELERRGAATGYARHEVSYAIRVGRYLGGIRADRLTQVDMRRLVQAAREEPGPRGLRRRASLVELSRFVVRVYRHARASGLVEVDPPRLPRNTLPDDARPARRLTEDEVRRLVAAGPVVAPWMGRLLQFCAWCPRRPVAIFALTVADCVRVATRPARREDVLVLFSRDKGGVGRGWTPLAEPALEALAAQLADRAPAGPEALVWPSVRGRPLDAAILSPQLARVARAAGVEDVRLYDLRKFGASRIYHELSGNLDATRRYTGHRSVQTLFRYVSAGQGQAEAAAERIGWSS